MAQVLHLYSVKKQHKHILYLFTAREIFSESHLHQKKQKKFGLAAEQAKCGSAKGGQKIQKQI